MKNNTEILKQLLSQRILVIDGAMGTIIQALKLDEAAFRGAQFKNHSRSLKGCNDLLSLTRPDAIENIHRQLPPAPPPPTQRRAPRHPPRRAPWRAPPPRRRVQARQAALRRRRDRPDQPH